MSVCPTCGQNLPPTYEANAATVYDAMKAGKELYRGQYGGWWLTHGGGPVSPVVVSVVRDMPGVHPAYSDTNDCLRFGPTIDVAATTDARKRGLIGKRELVFVQSTIRTTPEQLTPKSTDGDNS